MDTAPEGQRNGVGQRISTTLQHPSGVLEIVGGKPPGALPPAKFRRPSGPNPRRTPRQRGDGGEGEEEAFVHGKALGFKSGETQDRFSKLGERQRRSGLEHG